MALAIARGSGGAFGGSGGSAASYAWASRPSAASSGAGARIIITDIGPRRFEAVSDGTYWIPEPGAILAENLSIVTGVSSTSEQTILQLTLPAGILARRPFEVVNTWGKTTGTDSMAIRLRIGILGTTSDVAARGTALNGANYSVGTSFIWRPTDSTTLNPEGGPLDSTLTPNLGGSATGTGLTGRTFSTGGSIDSNALILSFNAQMGGLTSIPQVGYCAVRIL